MDLSKTSLIILIAIAFITITHFPVESLSEPLQRIYGYFAPSSEVHHVGNYHLDPLKLTVPVVPAYPPLKYASKPTPGVAVNSPGYQLLSSYHYNSVYEDGGGVVGIYVENIGDSDIFAYDLGLLDVDTNRWYGQKTGICLNPGEKKKLGNIAVLHTSDNAEKLILKLGISIMARTPSSQWYDYGKQYFDEFTVDVGQAVQVETPGYIHNPWNIFDRMNSKIEPFDAGVRKVAAGSAKKYPGQYNIYQICSIFDDSKDRLEYISDPRGSDMWSTPAESLETGAGDCEDHAILLASLVESIGGTSRIYITDNHAFAAVYIGHGTDTTDIVEAVRQYYGDLPVYYASDEYGAWLMMDPTSSVYAGGLPADTAPVKDGWTFQNTSKVIVIDIAPKVQEIK